MPQSYRLRTQVGVDQQIQLQLDQDFDFLELLSLKITQSDVYSRLCADYGVIVGRVVANGGYGVPNARVSVFVPLTDEDSLNTVISTLYPYKQPTDLNEDGYRYNLLPYQPQHGGHTPTGTFPSLTDVLNNPTVVEVYEKYYKYTVKTNDSGDYMIFGVPTGNQTIVLDMDLSDIGPFSFSPQDLIRLGKATEQQVNGARFRSSTNLAELPQIVNINTPISVNPFWGDEDFCQARIERLDFDLRDLGYEFTPTSVFMGSIFSTPDEDRLRTNCKPKDNMGNLCSLTTGPGSILAIRQTIQSDVDGRPVLEEFKLENDGKVIDDDGTWMIDVPMNLDYVVTNEFGEQIISNDPSIGIPTKGKYRFKVKWDQPGDLQEQVKRAYFLVPNIKEHWANSLNDPSFDETEDYVFTCDAQEKKSKYEFPVGQNIYSKTFSKATSITISNQQNIKLSTVGGVQVPEINVFTGTSSGVYTLVSQNQLPFTFDVNNNEKIKIEIIRKNASQNAKVSYSETLINGSEDSVVVSTNGLNGKLVLKTKLNVEDYQVFINNTLFTGDPEEVPVLNGQTIKIVAKGIEKDSFARLTYEFQTNGFAALQESYAFSLNWNDYYEIQDAIDCKDTFYEMRYNKVYSVSSLIDNYQKGTNFGPLSSLSTYFNRGRFIGVKEIDSRDCANSVNKFPVNDGVQNFDLLYFVVSILLQLLQVVGGILMFSYHILAFLWNNFAIPLIVALSTYFAYQAFQDVKAGIAAIVSSSGGGFANFLLALPFFLKAAGNITAGIALGVILFRLRNQKIPPIKLPMMTYPNCEACDCGDSSSDGSNVFTLGATCLSQTQVPNFTLNDFPAYEIDGDYPVNDDDYDTENGILKLVTSQALVGISGIKEKERLTGFYRVSKFGAFGLQLPLAERFNKFNFKTTYYTNNGFTPSNQMKVTIEPNLNGNKFFLDQSLTLVTNDGCGYSPGDLLTFVGFNNSKDPNPFSATTNFTGTNSITGNSLTPNIINITYADDINYNSNITKSFNLPTGPTSPYSAITRTDIGTGLSATTYTYPSDIEYYQVVDVLTVGEIRQQFCKTNVDYSISEILQSQMTVGYYFKGRNRPLTSDIDEIIFSYGTVPVPNGSGGVQPAPNNIQTQPTLFDDFDNYQVVILQRGVDPYSPLFDTQYDVSSIYGDTPGSRVVRGKYRINQPILNTNGVGPLTIEHQSITTNDGNDRGVKLFHTSNFFQPGSQYTGFTTDAHKYYSSLDSTGTVFRPFGYGITVGNSTTDSSSRLLSPNLNNLYYSRGNANQNRHRYYVSNDFIDGGSFMYAKLTKRYNGKNPDDYKDEANAEMYFSPMYSNINIGFSASTKNNMIMRSDRMPTSDTLQTNGGNSYQLHQNQNFSIYNLSNPSASGSATGFGTGASQGSLNEDGNFLSGVSQSFECRDMVSLNCYEYVNDTLTVIDNCDGGSVENGCYVFVRRPLSDLGKDIRYFSEWGYRFKFFYGLCRGVLSQTFSNNWVNGTLYAFPFQLNVFYTGVNATNANVAQRVYCKDNIVLHSESNNFYYRSSPYNDNTNEFVGTSVDVDFDPLNEKQLLYPTTMIDLGPRDSFIQDLVLSPEYDGYNMTNIPSTSYGDTSDLVNFFTYTRITNPSILKKIIKIKNSGIKLLFDNRKNNINDNKELGRVDGDLAQMMSINSEIGVIKYNSQFYQSTGGPNQPVIYNNTNGVFGVFFSSTTIDLQVKDYITPGKTNFRGSDGLLLADNQFTINSQVVPFYKWGLGSGLTIFGKPSNNWVTSSSDIIQGKKYQGLNRDDVPYFQGETQSTLPFPKNDLYERGYLFNYKNDSYAPNEFTNMETKFLVGAPFHFYFGIVKGASAMDRFVKKYVRQE